LPEDWTTAVAVDADDNVYVFNRGTQWLSSIRMGMYCGRGVTIGPDGSVYCVDNGDHTVRQFTPDGVLLMTLGEAHKSSSAMSRIPFNRPAHLAVDPRDGGLYIIDCWELMD